MRGLKIPLLKVGPTVTKRVLGLAVTKNAIGRIDSPVVDDLHDRRPWSNTTVTKRKWGRPEHNSDSGADLPTRRGADNAMVTKGGGAP
jgi:hypothetical protein